MTTGHDITTRIINIVLAEQIDITPIQQKTIVGVNNGGEYILNEYNRPPKFKPWIKSIEKLRDYINKKYLSVELKSPEIEDIFNFLHSDDNWKLSIENKDSVIGYNIIKEMINEIEKITKCQGSFVKVLNEKKNQF